MSDMCRIAVRAAAALLAFFTLGSFAFGDDVYRKPPQEILDVLNAAPTPEAVVNPTGTEVLLIERILYPPISDLAQPMLRLAGLRINPRNNGPHNAFLYRSVTLRHLDSSAGETKLVLPAGAEVSAPVWSPDGKLFAFTNMTEKAVELWVGDGRTGRVHRLNGIRVNAALVVSGFGPQRPPIHWMPDSRTLLVETVRSDRGTPPQEPTVPPGPHTQESLGKAGPAPTYEDLLRNDAFPKEVEVWNRSGQLLYKVASLPLENRVPIQGVPTGPRDCHWIPTEAASLDWRNVAPQT